ncbi:MAG: hypothetical protein H6Q42_3906 [Deltaproteobacteria bacterium]|nr:hypothetical protein [Deltaproteobacteria bacterium]
MYQRILVPLDGSELAECVLPHVEVLARGCQAKSLVFIRVVEPLRQVAGDYVMDPDQVKKIESESKLAAEAYSGEINRYRYTWTFRGKPLGVGKHCGSHSSFGLRTGVDGARAGVFSGILISGGGLLACPGNKKMGQNVRLNRKRLPK